MAQNRTKTSNTTAEPTTDWLERSILAVYNFLVLAVPLFFLFTTDELFEFNKMILVYYGTAVIGTLWIGRMIWHRRLLLRTTPLDIPILLFLGSQLLSTFFSIDIYTSLLGYYGRFHGGLVSSICYIVLFYAFVNTVRKKDLRGLLISTLVSATLVSLYASLEHFGHSFSCFLATSGQSFGADCWKQDVQSRVFASFGQPNWLAAYLIMLIPVTATLAALSGSYWKRSVYIVLSALFFATLLFTKSRSGILGLGLGMLVLMSLASIYFIRSKSNELSEHLKHHSIATVVTIAVIFFALAGIISAPFTPNFFDATTEQTSPVEAETTVQNRLEVGGSESGDIRKVVWTGALKVWQRYPILGSGVETFAYSYYKDRPLEHNTLSEWDFLYNKAHNEFLNILATTGVVGLGTYLFLLGAWSWYVLKHSLFTQTQRQPEKPLLMLALLAGVASVTVSNFFGFSTVMVSVLLFLYMAVSCVLESDAEQFPKLKQPTGLQISGLIVTGIVALALLVLITRYWNADKSYAQAQAYFNAGQFIPGVQSLSAAITLAPSEPLYYDELSLAYSQYALQLAETGQATAAAQAAETANAASEMALTLNPHHLNFYKSRARLFITLSALDPAYLEAAVRTLEIAREKAPTDPKLPYNIGLISFAQGDAERGFAALHKTIEMKPNYLQAREQLAAQYEQAGKLPEAIEQLEYIQTYLLPENETVSAKIASLSAQLDTSAAEAGT